MEKTPLVEKMAEKAFESEAFQKSWQMHERAFGPILLPAFTDSMAARVHLTNALNHISRRETDRGIELLEKIDFVIRQSKRELQLLIPYTEQSLASILYDEYAVKSVDYVENGILFDVVLDERGVGIFKKYVIE